MQTTPTPRPLIRLRLEEDGTGSLHIGEHDISSSVASFNIQFEGGPSGEKAIWVCLGGPVELEGPLAVHLTGDAAGLSQAAEIVRSIDAETAKKQVLGAGGLGGPNLAQGLLDLVAETLEKEATSG